MIILFLLSLAAFSYYRYWDYTYSKETILYDYSEGNWLFRDKYGYLNQRRALILQIAAFLGLIELQFHVLGFVPYMTSLTGTGMPSWLPTGLTSLLALISFFLVRKHKKLRAEYRPIQIKLLRQLRERVDIPFEELRTILRWINHGTAKKDRAWIPGFGFVYTEYKGGDIDLEKLTNGLKALSLEPEENWFIKERKI